MTELVTDWSLQQNWATRTVLFVLLSCTSKNESLHESHQKDLNSYPINRIYSNNQCEYSNPDFGICFHPYIYINVDIKSVN